MDFSTSPRLADIAPRLVPWPAPMDNRRSREGIARDCDGGPVFPRVSGAGSLAARLRGIRAARRRARRANAEARRVPRLARRVHDDDDRVLLAAGNASTFQRFRAAALPAVR